ncbi:Heavy metal-associated isoprenylated plant protein [Abeliophyllum distichum]|uniref:Heavy metal-associated isoprenylated plant protein n=1 Tax=Abeliophyllum distichum TaxID=126358 RepID=A0ABD1VBI6_9LAMI
MHKWMPFLDSPLSLPQCSIMVPEIENPRVTEIQVRIDCNGCVQKIKKALHGINGIYDLNIDFSQQKITVIGWADPEKIIKAIKKTRKNAIICSQTEPPDDQPPPDGGEPPPDSTNPPPEAEETPPVEQPKEPPSPENPPPEAKPSPLEAADQPSKPKDAEEIHVIYHHPPPEHGGCGGYGGGQSNVAYPGGGPGFRGEPPPRPIYVAHSYNTYRPSTYVTEYANFQQPPAGYSYSRPNHYGEEYRNGNGNLNITSMFSDENPNACKIV